MSSLLLLSLLLLVPLLYFLLKPPSLPSIPNATPNLPLIGNAIAYGINPVNFLTTQRARHGDIFLVNLGIIRIVFFLGPEGTNTVLRQTEKQGVSLYAALGFLIGGSVESGMTLYFAMLNIGLKAEGWVEASYRIMAKSLSAPDNLEYWRNQVQPLIQRKFEEWAEKGEPVSLFRGLSGIVMTTLVYLLLGDEFAEKHAKEIAPKVRKYESALQTPETKALPRWASKNGRFMDAVEQRMCKLVGDEIARRLENPNKYKDYPDYLQHVLNTCGGKYASGSSHFPSTNAVYSYHILGLLNGGHTNETSTFIWSILHTTQSGLLPELRRTKSKDLLEAVFREIGRLYTNLMNLRKLTTPQVILGKSLPKGQFIACSPLITARDSNLFPDADKFKPERWLSGDKMDEARVKNLTRSGAFVHFGKGQHACLGEKIGRMMVLDILWDTILGNGDDPGYDIEFVSGIREGVGVDNVGVEPAWTQENLGTPFEKGQPVMVRFMRRTNAS